MLNNPSNDDADGYPLDLGKIINRIIALLWLPIPEVMRRGFLRDFEAYLSRTGR
jgi:hypothetical protein